MFTSRQVVKNFISKLWGLGATINPVFMIIGEGINFQQKL